MRYYFFLAFAFLFILSLSLTSGLSVDFTSPTPSNASTISSRNFIINATIDSENPLSSIIYNWNNTNYSIYDDSLVLYYNFDNRSALGENDTHVKDISRYGNNGTIFGTIFNVSGKYNGAYTFDGINDYINTSLSFNYSAINFTISAWIKPVSIDNIKTIIGANVDGSNKAWQLEVTPTNRLIFDYQNISSQSTQIFYPNSNILSLNEWNLVTLVIYPNSNVSFYVNGNLVYNYTLLSSLKTFGNPNIMIGSRRGSSEFFNGTIDDVEIYNRPLSSSRIMNLYKTSLTKFNSTQYVIGVNQTNVIGINYNNYLLFANDTSNNQNSSNLAVRLVSNINLSSSLIGTINNNFYGINTHGRYTSSQSFIDTNNDGVLDLPINLTFHTEQILKLKTDVMRVDAYLSSVSINSSFFNATNGSKFNNIRLASDAVKFSYDNNITAIVIIDETPAFVQNRSSSYCDSSAYYSCPVNDTNLYKTTVKNYVNNITNNGQYISAVRFQVKNEPYLSSWLNNLSTDNITKATEYVKFYNATYWAIKEIYPTAKVGTGSFQTFYTNMVNTVLSNKTVIGYDWDFLTVHSYSAYGSVSGLDNSNDIVKTSMDNLLVRCQVYNANCSDVMYTEWGIQNSTIQNSSSYNQYYQASLSNVIAQVINNYPYNVSLVYYQYSEIYDYNNTAYYPEYPKLFSMLSEPRLDNSFYVPYNVIYNFVRYVPANGLVYQTTIDSSEYIVTWTKEVLSSKYSLTVTNKINDKQNISLNCGSFTGNLIDVVSGQLYNCADGVVNLGVFSEYQYRIFTEVLYMLNESSGNQTLRQNYLRELNFSANDTWITSHTDTQIRIASTLPNNTNVLVKLINTTCNFDYNDILRYTPKNGAAIDYVGDQAQSVCLALTTTGYELTLNQSSESNVIDFLYTSNPSPIQAQPTQPIINSNGVIVPWNPNGQQNQGNQSLNQTIVKPKEKPINKLNISTPIIILGVAFLIVVGILFAIAIDLVKKAKRK